MSENTSKRRFWKSFTESPKKKKEKKKDDQASFFDHEDDELKEIRSLWTQIRPIHLNELKTKIILEGELEKKGKVMGKWKSRHYLLTQNYLIYQEKKKSTKYIKAAHLERVRIQFIVLQEKNKPQKFGFRLLKNRDISEIFTTNEELFKAFKKELELRCVQINFQENYTVEKMIGKGSFGKVFLVKRNQDQQNFAAKMFLKESIKQINKGKATLLNEITILRGLNHPGVMKLYEVYENPIAVYMIVELLSGGELFEKLKEKKAFTENECALILRRVIEPLIYVHDQNIIHRDIKPENLILRSRSSDYDIVVADFGLATELKPNKILHLRCGTPGFCAPEIIGTKSKVLNYDFKVDVFSLGCIFFLIMTGRNPFFIHKDQRGVLSRNKRGEISFDDPKIQYYSLNAQDLLKKMLIKNPDERPTFREILTHEFLNLHEKISGDHISNINKQIFLSSGTYYEKKGSQDGQKLNSKDTLNSVVSADLGSFFVGRSNFMKGNLDTVQDMSVNMGESKNYNLLSVSMNDSPTKVKRSSFARYSMRENLVVSIGVKSKTDNPSIFANSLIPADTEQNHDLIPSPSSKNSDSDSIISACKDGKDFEENRADSANDFSNTPEDNQIMQNQIMKLKSAVFQNPFYEDSNNIESPLRFKMNHLLNIANEIKSLSITQTRTIEEINICNSEEIGTFQARISQKIKTTE